MSTPPSTPPKTVVIVEDDSDLRSTIQKTVELGGWKVTHTFPNAEKAIPILEAEVPDLILMDIQLPGISGIELTRLLSATHTEPTILMLTVYDHSKGVFEAIAAGASGYLLKRDITNRLLESMEEVLNGNSPVSSSIARKMFKHFTQQGSSNSAEKQEWKLTKREQEILEGLVNGFLYKQIAAQHQISIDTVRFHLRNIYKKLHVSSRTEAVVKYLGR